MNRFESITSANLHLFVISLRDIKSSTQSIKNNWYHITSRTYRYSVMTQYSYFAFKLKDSERCECNNIIVYLGGRGTILYLILQLAYWLLNLN